MFDRSIKGGKIPLSSRCLRRACFLETAPVNEQHKAKALNVTASSHASIIISMISFGKYANAMVLKAFFQLNGGVPLYVSRIL